MPSTILLAHRYPLVREGLKAVFERHTDMDVIGETDSGLETVILVARLRPDVLVIYVMMPGLSGLQVTRQVRQRWPRTHVIVLSMSVNVTHVRAAILGIGRRTVETHRAHLMKKLGLRTKTDLFRYALHRGILPMEP